MDRYLTKLIKWESAPSPVPEWREYHMVFITDPLAPICYDTHNKDVKRIRDQADITGKRATTHFDRSNKASDAIENSVNTRDIESAVGWHLTSEGQKTYLTGALVTSFVLSAAKWKDADSFLCSWESDGTDIPDRLLSKVFTGLYDIITNINKLQKKHDLESEKNTCEVFTYLRKVFLEDAVYLIDLYPDWPVYRHHPVFKDPLWTVYKAAETERVAERHKRFMAATTIGQIESLIRPRAPKKPNAIATTTFTDEEIQAAADSLATDEYKTMPFVLEPTDILAGYTQYTTVWMKQPRLNWKEWFGPNAKVNSSRYNKVVDMYKYIDHNTSTSPATAESVVARLVKVAADLKVTQACLVKNIFYFYKHPPSPTAHHQPMFTKDRIEATFLANGFTM